MSRSPEVRPLLVLVSGTPAAGKTTLAHRLSKALSIPLISRDELKELLDDSLRTLVDVHPSVVSRAHFRLFYGLVDRLLRAGTSIVAESALHRDLAPGEVRPLVARARTVLVHCTTRPGENEYRFLARFAEGGRHPCHPDAAYIAQLRAGEAPWEPYSEPLPLGVPTVRVDTTDGYLPSFDAIVDFIRSSALS